MEKLWWSNQLMVMMMMMIEISNEMNIVWFLSYDDDPNSDPNM